MARDYAKEESNKALVKASFDRWKNGTGGPFELLASDVERTIVGTSPLSKTYHSKQEFLDVVIRFALFATRPTIFTSTFCQERTCHCAAVGDESCQFRTPTSTAKGAATEAPHPCVYWFSASEQVLSASFAF
jgi:ketosteroid isomerase-like protein